MTDPCDVTWISEQLEDGQVGFRIGRAGDELVADFVGIGVLRAKRTGGASVFTPSPTADPVAVAKVKAGLLPALLRHLDGKLTLHGSAVAFGDVAIACVGLSGVGKSTAAARLCEAHGGALIADDTVAIEFGDTEIHVHPTERVSWLVSGLSRPTADGGAKLPVPPRARAEGPRRLVAVCRLLFDDALEGAVVRRMRGHDALGALLPAVIRFVLDEPSAQVQEAEHLDVLATRVPIFEVARSGAEATLGPCIDELARLAHHQEKR